MKLADLHRYPGHGPGLWSFAAASSEYRIIPQQIRARDGAVSLATLYVSRQGGSAVHLFHPRSDVRQHYLVPALLAAGFSVCAHCSRFLNSDSMLVDELVLDVAAGVIRLKELGFDRLVALGNSNGGPPLLLYQGQAARPPTSRRFGLAGTELPSYSGMVLLAAMPSQAELLRRVIDPSLTNEADPGSLEPELDMYAAQNGFRPLPGASRYSSEFLARYRAAQDERLARIDADARARVEERKAELERLGAAEVSDLSPLERLRLERRCHRDRSLLIHRTEANPIYTDDALEPNQRAPGSFFSPRPDLSNYSSLGFARSVTPEAWLSTWSSVRAVARPLDGMEGLLEPTLIVSYAGDPVVMPSDAARLLVACPAKDKRSIEVPGDHLGFGAGGVGDNDGRERAGQVISRWLCERYESRVEKNRSFA